MTPPCRYANRSTEQVDEHDHALPSERDLCAWAHFHPDAPAALIKAPPWLARVALAGHLMTPTNCGAGCPGYEAGPPVEGP
jgi:hypothetical protein